LQKLNGGQIRKNFKRKSTEGLSTIMIFIAFSSYTLWVIRGFLEEELVLIWGRSLGVLNSEDYSILGFLYKKKRNK